MIGLSKMHCFIDGFLLEFFFFFSRVCWDQGETLLMWMQMPAITSFEHKLLYSLLCQDRFLKWKDICFVDILGCCCCCFLVFFSFDWRVPFLGYYYNFLLILYSYNCTFCVCSICLSFMPSKVPDIYFIGLFY